MSKIILWTNEETAKIRELKLAGSTYSHMADVILDLFGLERHPDRIKDHWHRMVAKEDLQTPSLDRQEADEVTAMLHEGAAWSSIAVRIGLPEHVLRYRYGIRAQRRPRWRPPTPNSQPMPPGVASRIRRLAASGYSRIGIAGQLRVPYSWIDRILGKTEADKLLAKIVSQRRQATNSAECDRIDVDGLARFSTDSRI